MFYFFYIVYLLFKFYYNYQLTSNLFSNLCDLILISDNKNILEDCIINDEWIKNSDDYSSKNSIFIYELSNKNRRVFTLEYLLNKQISKKSITINNISIINNYDYINNINNKTLNANKSIIDNEQNLIPFKPVLFSNNFPYVLSQGDSFDIIIEYNCITKWGDVIINFEILDENNKNISFEIYYKKICDASYKQKKNFSYLILILFYIIYIHLSSNDFLTKRIKFVIVNIEEIMQAKYVENILYICFVVIVTILFFIIIGYIYLISFFFTSLVSIISFKSFVKYFFKMISMEMIKYLENIKYNLFDIQLDSAKILCYGISLIFYIFWYILPNNNLQIIINNFIVFVTIYICLHKIEWKKLYMIILLILTVFIYQISFLFFIEGLPLVQRETIYNITTKYVINVPIKFILPDLIKSPYEEVYFFSIVDVLLLNFLLRYCEKWININRNYYVISLYTSHLGILINLILFYGFKFYPPMYMIPTMLCLFSVVFYSIYSKNFLVFCDYNEEKSLYEKENIIIDNFESDDDDDSSNEAPNENLLQNISKNNNDIIFNNNEFLNNGETINNIKIIKNKSDGLFNNKHHHNSDFSNSSLNNFYSELYSLGLDKKNFSDNNIINYSNYNNDINKIDDNNSNNNNKEKKVTFNNYNQQSFGNLNDGLHNNNIHKIHTEDSLFKKNNNEEKNLKIEMKEVKEENDEKDNKSNFSFNEK